MVKGGGIRRAATSTDYGALQESMRVRGKDRVRISEAKVPKKQPDPKILDTRRPVNKARPPA